MSTIFSRGIIPPFLFFVFSLVCLTKSRAALVVMPRVDYKLMVADFQDDIQQFQLNQEEIKKAVSWLFENDRLDHDFSKGITANTSFEVYWKNLGKDWYMVDMNQDGQKELIYSGKSFRAEEKEFFQLFMKYGSVWKQDYWDEGHFAGYQIQPNTGEILLVHHRYPCCYQASHNINRLRLVRGKIKMYKKLFLARDSAMKGQFFPEKVTYTTNVLFLKKETMLRWSGEKIDTDAMFSSPTNEILPYEKGASFQILASKGDWKYVVMLSPPKNVPSRVANAQNLQDVHVMGWFYKPAF